MDARQASGGFPRYVSSGRTPILGLVMGLGAGTAAALFLSVLYAYGTIYIPIVQIEFLLTMAFGAAIGAATAVVMHFFKVRNRWVVAASGLVLGTFGWLVSWPPWLYGVFARAEIDVSPLDVLNPLFLVEAIPEIYATGTWSMSSSSTEGVSGLMLGFVWLVEAATIVICATLAAWTVSSERVFCEACETWCTVVDGQALYGFDEGPGLVTALVDRGDLAALVAAPGPTDPSKWVQLKLGFCPSCHQTNVVQLDTVLIVPAPRGGTERRQKVLEPFRCISREQMDWLRSQLGQRHVG